ncbi:unnamed protein product [Arabidopsis lyrata]|uniref:Predicted protein n=1 Tax=Arabidopsis lyrata subsp. lyrata TaxID=81972 RepID=D7KKG5_ARALL|nr:predicted protein [Arabidopsis lyrata subsp. lyrata]CAH8255514.1 unnamed protein product [Arabidopsis lyrata]
MQPSRLLPYQPPSSQISLDSLQPPIRDSPETYRGRTTPPTQATIYQKELSFQTKESMMIEKSVTVHQKSPDPLDTGVSLRRDLLRIPVTCPDMTLSGALINRNTVPINLICSGERGLLQEQRIGMAALKS